MSYYPEMPPEYQMLEDPEAAQRFADILTPHVAQISNALKAAGFEPIALLNVCRLILLYTAAIYDNKATGHPSKDATRHMLGSLTGLLRTNQDI